MKTPDSGPLNQKELRDRVPFREMGKIDFGTVAFPLANEIVQELRDKVGMRGLVSDTDFDKIKRLKDAIEGLLVQHLMELQEEVVKKPAS
jgi:hypothetical protein